MRPNFGDQMAAYGSLDPKAGPKQWDDTPKEGVDRNPDHMRSTSRAYIEEHSGSILWVLQVRGIGAIVMRAHHADDGTLVFDSVSEFDRETIGYYPEN